MYVGMKLKEISTYSSHMEKNKPGNICKICNRKFSQKHRLQDHVTRMHTARGRQLPCPFAQCGKSFRVKVDVSRHVKNMHSTSKRPLITCTFVGCGKTYKH